MGFMAFLEQHLYYPFCFFFFNDTATTEIYTLSLHDALPILRWAQRMQPPPAAVVPPPPTQDRKSTRLNSSHSSISYAVFCLKKKKKISKNYHSKLNKKKTKFKFYKYNEP